MSYTTIDKVRLNAGFENNGNIDDSTQIEPKVLSANSEIDSYIGRRYDLPLSEAYDQYVGSDAENLLCEIATELGGALLLMQQYEGQGGVLMDMATDKYQTAIKRLEKIKTGETLLVGKDGQPLKIRDEAVVGVVGYPCRSIDVPPIFTRNDKY